MYVLVDILFIPLLCMLMLLTQKISTCTYRLDMRAKPKIVALNLQYALRERLVPNQTKYAG